MPLSLSHQLKENSPRLLLCHVIIYKPPLPWHGIKNRCIFSFYYYYFYSGSRSGAHKYMEQRFLSLLLARSLALSILFVASISEANREVSTKTGYPCHAESHTTSHSRVLRQDSARGPAGSSREMHIINKCVLQKLAIQRYLDSKFPFVSRSDFPTSN